MDSINITTTKEYDISLQAEDIKIVNLDDYYTKAESDAKYQPIGDYVTESELVLYKEEIDNLIGNINNELASI